ncbi:MAG TPA: proton-conducting transporter membrane subunit, partial [Pirellulales bacterium]|nr:proton-conducting transporter membrane subunit [Pirellulales bacterium]
MPALTIAIPLLAAAVLMALSKVAPRRLSDVVALAVTGAVLGLCLLLARRAVEGPIVYWFGGWQPRGDVAVGIAFYVDSLSAGLAGLAALLTLGSLLFAWHYFDSVGALFHVLMLIFLAAMVGFCFSGDIFTLFVFFELMSATAFALTGYKIEASALEGALNFGITNSIAAFFVLWGIGLLYGRTGALNLAQLGETLSTASPDALVSMAFVLICSGFFIKGAIVPFHFWLSDAHAVAPTPVCVLFSGVMVEMGLYAATRVWWTVFSGVLGDKQSAIVDTWLMAGAVTALVGGAACFMQRHLKRLLALSTVSHMGIVLMGLGQFSSLALAGTAIYVAGHALVKGALFLCAGILLHRLGDVDVVKLRGKGRHLHITATIVVLAGLGLAGMPPFGTYVGKAIIDKAAEEAGSWTAIVGLIASALTAAAVFRAAGRVFLGAGPPSNEEQESATEKEGRETKGGRGRVPWLMLAPAVGMTILALSFGLLPGQQSFCQSQADGFQDRREYA